MSFVDFSLNIFLWILEKVFPFVLVILVWFMLLAGLIFIIVSIIKFVRFIFE